MDHNIQKLQYFVGKICTILTPPTNRTFDDMTHANCFVGIVEDINELGIWIQYPSSQQKAFFPVPIIGIIEESHRPMTEEEASIVKTQLEEKIKKPNSINELKGLKENWQTFKEKK
jgi:hypothetical protein